MAVTSRFADSVLDFSFRSDLFVDEIEDGVCIELKPPLRLQSACVIFVKRYAAMAMVKTSLAACRRAQIDMGFGRFGSTIPMAFKALEAMLAG